LRRNLAWFSRDTSGRDIIVGTARDGIEFELRKRDFAAGKLEAGLLRPGLLDGGYGFTACS